MDIIQVNIKHIDRWVIRKDFGNYVVNFENIVGDNIYKRQYYYGKNIFEAAKAIENNFSIAGNKSLVYDLIAQAIESAVLNGEGYFTIEWD